MHPNPKRILPILALVLLGALGWWYFSSQKANAQTGGLNASGTIEATEVILAPEIGGKIAEMLVKEGDAVQAGQPLARLEASLLLAQLDQAKAALATAQANYDLVAAGTPDEQRQLAVAAAELEATQAQQTIDSLNDTAQLAAAQALQAVAAADKQLDQATQRFDSLGEAADQADIDAADATVTLALDKLDKLREKFEPYQNKPKDNLIRANLQAQMADAEKKYDAAVTRLNNLLGKANRFEFALAEANQLLAQEQLAEARRKYEDVKDGPDPDALVLAERRLATANARLAAAKAEPTSEQLAVAQAQVGSAQAALDVVQAQADKLVITAPIEGTIMSRAVEPGEIVAPGAVLLALSDLNDLTITVYVPEDRYGQIKLGETVTLTTDSFPGKKFQATVIDIADQAEFTPRNVQTSEGRRTTVFAIKLGLKNEDAVLKPGMPADVRFR